MAEIPYDISIPTKLLLDRSIDDSYKIAYAFIRMRCGLNGFIWHHNDTLALDINRNERSIQRAIKALTKERYIYKDVKATDKALYSGTYKEKDGTLKPYWEAVKGKRVIWIYEAWLKANDDLKYPKHPNNKGKSKPPTTPTAQDYSKFQKHIRDTYMDEIIMFANKEHAIGIDILGKLVKCSPKGWVLEYLKTEEALKIWRYMFTNPDKLLNPGTGAVLVHR